MVILDKNSGTIFHCFFKYYFFIISFIVTPIVLEILKSVFVLTWFEPERTLFNVVAEIPQSFAKLDTDKFFVFINFNNNFFLSYFPRFNNYTKFSTKL